MGVLVIYDVDANTAICYCLRGTVDRYGRKTWVALVYICQLCVMFYAV
jgi:hypothetical protein